METRRRRKLAWTKNQQEVAALVKEGKDNQEIYQLGYGKATVSRVRTALKSGGNEPKDTSQTSQPLSPLSQPGTRVRVRTLDPVEVGGLYIEPADWRVNQYGGFLILNTYEHAKETLSYGGTVGDFLCEAVQITRKVMGLDLMSDVYLLKEAADNGRREEDGEGEGVLAEAGDELDGEDG